VVGDDKIKQQDIERLVLKEFCIVKFNWI
jgi:hypothetical protein